jgi:ubiquinol-cytochrome c reductase cytochrome b subunit
MSFRGAIVTTSSASVVFIVGDTIVTRLWGGFSVDNATLNRFSSPYHSLLFVIAGASPIYPAALY